MIYLVSSIDEFYVTGDAVYTGDLVVENIKVLLEIVEKETFYPVEHIQYEVAVTDDNRYSIGPMDLRKDSYSGLPYFSKCEDGEYLILVYLIVNDYTFAAENEKVIILNNSTFPAQVFK